MTISTSDAIVRVRTAMLDDPLGERWDADDVRESLEYALSEIFDVYIAKGGKRFSRPASVTSDAGGLVDLSSLLTIGQLHSAWVPQGGNRFPLAMSDEKNIVRPYHSLTFTLDYSPRPELPAVDTNPMVGDGTTLELEGSWKTFEEAVMIRSALNLMSKNADRVAWLRDREARTMESLMVAVNPPGPRHFPRRDGNNLFRGVGVAYRHSQAEMLVGYMRGFW
jgi:hypothetical protein